MKPQGQGQELFWLRVVAWIIVRRNRKRRQGSGIVIPEGCNARVSGFLFEMRDETEGNWPSVWLEDGAILVAGTNTGAAVGGRLNDAVNARVKNRRLELLNWNDGRWLPVVCRSGVLWVLEEVADWGDLNRTLEGANVRFNGAWVEIQDEVSLEWLKLKGAGKALVVER